MKKVSLILTVFILFSTVIFAGETKVDTIAREVIKGYKTKNAELLKKNASGMIKQAINDSYFRDKQNADIIKAAENWDGKIRDIGYEVTNIMGNKLTMATVYFANTQDSNEIYVVNLVKHGSRNWVMFAKGIDKEKRSDFKKLSKSPTGENSTKSQIATASNNKDQVYDVNAVKSDFALEMAEGDKINGISINILMKNFNKMNDDNFYIILSHGDDFLQASYSDKGYTVEYKENGVQYTAKDLLPKETTSNLFKKYLNGDKKWKNGVEWEIAK